MNRVGTLGRSSEGEAARAQAARELRRQKVLRAAMSSGLPELPRDRLRFGRFGEVEDTGSGEFYGVIRGEVVEARWSPASAFFLDPDATVVWLEPRRRPRA